MIPAGGILRVHFGRKGLSGPADMFLPGFKELGLSDSIALYRSNQFNKPEDMLDFVSCNGGQSRIYEAIKALEWPTSLTSVPLPRTAGATIAHYAEDSYGHNSNSPDGWFADHTPTLGLPNDPGSIYSMYSGCAGYANGISMGLLTKFHRPWIGERWDITLYNMRQAAGTAWIVFGRKYGKVISMKPFGMPGCNLVVSLDVIVPVRTTLTKGVLSMTIPRDVSFTGLAIYAQGLVPDNSVPNPAKALLTNALVARIGSR